MKYKDFTGVRIRKIQVLEPTSQRIRGAVVWKCRCDCGKEILVESRKLKPGCIYSCGCEKSPCEETSDLTGFLFGRLKVLGRSGNRTKDRNPLWSCQCQCGNIIETTKGKLLSGTVSSCGCARTPDLKDWCGKRFGKLTVLSYVGKENGFHIWHCRCDCGKEVNVRQSNLQNGWTTSCGCKRNPGKNLHYINGTCLEMLRPDLMYKTNTSGVKGVYYSRTRNKWIAQIMFRQKCYYLGGYDNIEEAAQARAEAEHNIFGDFLGWYEDMYFRKRKDQGENREKKKRCIEN